MPPWYLARGRVQHIINTIVDGFVKSPPALLCYPFRHCGVAECTTHSSRVPRLATGAFFFAVSRFFVVDKGILYGN